MRILLATHQFSWIGGADTYALTVAEHLQRLGHGVTIFAGELGEMTGAARASGIEVTDDESALTEPDVVYAQDAYAALLLADRFPRTPQAMAIHADEYDLWLPPQLPGVTAAVVALHERVAKRARAAAVVPEIVRLRQPVDTERFSPRGPLRDPPRRALLLGNYLTGDQLAVVAQACEEAGIEWEQVGYRNGGTPTLEPERLMGDADIVIGKARVIVEAMASGRAAYVYDHNGGDGWVTSERYALLEADNFGGQAEPVAADLEGLRADLQGYRPDMGPANRQLAVANHSANKHAQELALLFGRLNPRPRPVDGPLRELARLVRVQADIDRRAYALAAEAREARERERALRAELEAAQERIEELDATARDALAREQALRRQRRVRIGLALGRALDLIRRPFR